MSFVSCVFVCRVSCLVSRVVDVYNCVLLTDLVCDDDVDDDVDVVIRRFGPLRQGHKVSQNLLVDARLE